MECSIMLSGLLSYDFITHRGPDFWWIPVPEWQSTVRSPSFVEVQVE